jgi:hypothetical protein
LVSWQPNIFFAESDGFDVLRCGYFVMQRCLGETRFDVIKRKNEKDLL